MSDLTTRLLAEIERREAWEAALAPLYPPKRYGDDQLARDNRAYLAALREIVGLHRVDPSDECHPLCVLCGWADGEWPCGTVLAVAGALGVEG